MRTFIPLASAFFLFLFLPRQAAAQELNAPELDGGLVLRAWQHTYPDKIGTVAWRDGDWTVQAGGETFYWAAGRLLPEALLPEREKWSPSILEVYPPSVPSPDSYSPQYIQTLRRQGNADARLDHDNYHRAFQGKIYGGLTRKEAEANLARLTFLGKTLSVHRDIIPPLNRVEAAIREAAAEDGETAAFLASIGQVGGYNWREIQGTERMSSHSWGLAVDIQPAEIGGKSIYWRWERDRNSNWILIPLEKRWNPPDTVIRAFENEGFIWGGKWGLFDNMHFEFRPELHEINRLLAAEALEARIAADRQNTQPPGRAARRQSERTDLHHIYPMDIIIRN
jgi:hypothetical protein